MLKSLDINRRLWFSSEVGQAQRTEGTCGADPNRATPVRPAGAGAACSVATTEVHRFNPPGLLWRVHAARKEAVRLAQRRLVVSDIHGESQRLAKVLALAHYDPAADRLFLLGDYIDRGPDSRGTLEIVEELVSRGAVALLGNHDLMMVSTYHDAGNLPLWLYNGGYTTLAEFGGVIPARWVRFLEGLPTHHEEPDCIMVHAGLVPGVPLDEQSDQDKVWIREPFLSQYRGKLVYFGHTPTCLLHGEERWEPWYGEDKVGIDTGAVYGGVLTLLDIDSGQMWTA